MTSAPNSPPAPGTYRAALRNVEFDAVAGSSLISILGDSAAYLALTVLVYQRTGSALLSALIFSVGFLPYLVGGTLLSALVDRFPPKSLLVGIDVIGALLVGITAIPGVPIPALFAMLFVIGALAPVRSGTASGLLAEILTGDTFVAGRSLQRIFSQTAQIGGAGIGGVLIGGFGPRGALVADTASFLASATMTALLIRNHRIRGAAAAGSLMADSLSGVRDVWAIVPLRRLLVLGWVVPFIAVAPEALGAPAITEGGHRAALIGLWMIAIPIGTVLGDVLMVLVVPAGRRQALIGPLALLLTAVLISFAADPPLWMAIGVLVLSGALSGYGVGLDQALRVATTPALMARMYALNSTGLMVSQGLGFAAAGALGQLVPAHVAIALAGGIGLLCVTGLAGHSADSRRA